MSLSYLQPVDEAFTLDDYKPQQVGFQLHKHLPSIGLPNLTDVKIAFFCIETEGQSFYRFRQHLYSLFMGNWNFAIADLGNLPLGETDDDIENMRKEYEKRRDVGVEMINAIPGLSVVKPDGAFYLFVKCKEVDSDSLRFCKKMLEEANVATVPGVGFGMEGYFRISFATDIESIKKAIERIANFVKSYKI